MYHTVLFGSDQLIAVVVGFHNPLAEGLADDGVGNVADELARKASPILLLREVV